MENKPGSGSASPFGNEKGATKSGGSYSGSHDFIKDPASGAPKTGGRDFTEENLNEKQKEGSGCNTESIPSGGKLPFPEADPGKREGNAIESEVSHKPFKLGGGG